MRETRDEWPDVFEKGYCFKIGKVSTVRPGDDASIISSGVMTSEAIRASQSLMEAVKDVIARKRIK